MSEVEGGRWDLRWESLGKWARGEWGHVKVLGDEVDMTTFGYFVY